MAHILISAGEKSGDRYAADLAHEIRAARPETEFAGLGGDCLRGAGVRLHRHIDQMTAMGIAEVLTSLPRHALLLHRFRSELRAGRYDLVVLVDYPDFNLRLARIAHAAGVPVLYYVAPQLWAWRAGRSRQLGRDVDELAVILPFERDFLAGRGVASTWVGHPLLDADPLPSRADARRALGLRPESPVLALFPGSRSHEISRHWPVFLATARKLAAGLEDVTVLVGAPVPDPGVANLLILPDSLPLVLAASDAALCKSGTVSLQTALAELPCVIAYRMNPISHMIARRLVRVPHIGMVNLLMGERVAPEFVQDAATPANLAGALRPLLCADGGAAGRQRAAFAGLRRRLGEPGATRRVAELALGMLP